MEINLLNFNYACKPDNKKITQVCELLLGSCEAHSIEINEIGLGNVFGECYAPTAGEAFDIIVLDVIRTL